MFDAQHSKRPESDRGPTTPEQQSANPKQGRLHQTGDLTRLPVYAQAWGNLPPPWLRWPTSQQQASSPEPSRERQVEEELQDDLVPKHRNEPLPIPVQKGPLPVQRVEAVSLPAYTQLAWGNQPPPWLRLPVQRKELREEARVQEREEPLTQRKENTTGLPDHLKAGVENLSGLSMDDVKVHYNSSQPAEVQALAYTQGTNIHVASGQEQHLAHEAWHVVQQKQGRVQPTMQAKGLAINDDQELEKEADVMGNEATFVAHELTHVLQQRGNGRGVSAGQAQQEIHHEGETATSPIQSFPSAGIIQCLKHTVQDVQTALQDLTALNIPEHEKKWIRDFELVYDHHNDDFIYLKADARQEGDLEANKARYWYRAMIEDEFRKLSKSWTIPQNDNYGGIATNRSYAKKYLTSKGASHLVEFDTYGQGELFELFKENGITIKAEGKGGTFGLGDKGTQDKRAKGKGESEKVTARDLFSKSGFADRPRLVNLKIKNPLG